MRNFRKRVAYSLCIALSLVMTSVRSQVSYGDNAAAGKYITIRDVKHYYEVYGQGKPLLLIHGNSTGIKGWKDQISYFSKTRKVYAIDCRGRGKSDKGRDSLTYEGMAADMDAFLRLVGEDSVDVIGKSDGAVVALFMAMRYPQRVRRIVSFSANLTPDSTALYPETISSIKREREQADSMLRAKNTSRDWQFEIHRLRLMEFQPNITATDLSVIRRPVLVISCDRDVIREDHTMLIYRSIPGASLSFVQGETHSFPKKNPGLFNEIAGKFLAGPVHSRAYRFMK